MFDSLHRPRLSPVARTATRQVLPPKVRRPGDVDAAAEWRANEVGKRIGRELPSSAMVPGELGTAAREVAERYLGTPLEGTELREGNAASPAANTRAALASTEGSVISFNDAQLSDRPLGRVLLGHELTHVAEQRLRGTSAVQLSVLSNQLKVGWGLSKKKGLVFQELRILRPGSFQGDPETLKWLAETFGSESDDYWLAVNLMKYGPEPLWPNDALSERHARAQAHQWAPESGGIGATVAVTPEQRAVRAYFFPGQTDRRALVIGGMHGSELSAIEVAERLIEDLKAAPTPPFFTVIVVPTLFPDSRARAEAAPKEIGSGKDVGRNLPGGLDPNRNMPATGTDFDSKVAKDSRGRDIAAENQALLELIQRFHPTRLASVHATKTLTNAGIYADPRTKAPVDPTKSPEGEALGFEPDNHLAIRMAKAASGGGAAVPGNQLKRDPANPIYPLDPAAAPAGSIQRRTSTETSGKHHQPGVSVGEYASTATPSRGAMSVITIELNTAKRSEDQPTEAKKQARRQEVAAHSAALRDVFLGSPEGVEEKLP